MSCLRPVRANLASWTKSRLLSRCAAESWFTSFGFITLRYGHTGLVVKMKIDTRPLQVEGMVIPQRFSPVSNETRRCFRGGELIELQPESPALRTFAGLARRNETGSRSLT